jgi:hypothetical protein
MSFNNNIVPFSLLRLKFSLTYKLKTYSRNANKTFAYHHNHASLVYSYTLAGTIDILYTLDSASNYSAIQKLKPWLQTQDVPMKWEDSYVFYFLIKQGT